MGLFNFVSNWQGLLIDRPLDAKMRETAEVGKAVALENVHRITGYLASTISSEYDQRRKVVMLHADASYALIEETRGPTRRYSEHHYLAPAARAMGKVWGGNFELHLPNAAGSAESIAGQQGRLKKALGRRFFGLGSGVAGRTTIHARRHHHLKPAIPTDPTTPLL